jgi:PiT family inorganic phosphate transporter
MGIIWLLLIVAGVMTQDHLPTGVIISSSVAISLGTRVGGWRIAPTRGQKITKLKPIGGFVAESGNIVAAGVLTNPSAGLMSVVASWVGRLWR